MATLKTISTSKDTMNISPIVVRSDKTTRLIFCPSWVSTSGNPLRGGFRFEKKSPLGEWQTVGHKSLSTLKKNEGYELHLSGEEMAYLFSRLEELKQIFTTFGHDYGTRTLIVSEENADTILLQIGSVKNREFVITELKKLEQDNFENINSVLARTKLEIAIEEFEKNLSNSNESFWESFFGINPWILQQVFTFPVIYLNGETYLGGKSSKGRFGKGGVATDFLFMNDSCGSFAVVEIKTPSCNLVDGLYRGKKKSDENNETYEIAGELTGGIVQMENQIYTAITYFKSQLKETYTELTQINPVGILIAGNYDSLSDIQKRSFNLFRKSCTKNQIFTFDEVLKKLKLLRTVYES